MDLALSRVLDNIEHDLTALSADLKKLDDKLERQHTSIQTQVSTVRETYVKKADYDDDRRTRRTILMWGIGLMLTIAIATWTIVASRPDPIIIEEVILLGLSLRRAYAD